MREDWIECTLGELLSVSSGKGLTSKKMDGGIYPVYGGNGITGYHSQKIFSEQKLIIGRVGVRCGVTHITQEKSWVTDNALVVNFKSSDFDLKFTKLKLEYENLNKLSNSTAQPVISGTKIYSYLISLPPLVEQKAIVKKIEELYSSLDSGIADLKKAQDQLVIYRQAVLKKAFEGELTKEWREKQTNLPSADELLEQIKEERQKHYEQKLSDWKKAVKVWEKNENGKKPSRISKPKEFPEVKSEEVEKYDSIPRNWFWTRFGTITYKIGDIDHKMPKTVEKGMPYVSTGNIGKDGKIDFNKAKQISRVDFDRLALKIKPEKGDIIFPRYGTIGRNILIDYDKEFLVSYSCAIIKNITKIMDEKFALYYSLSPVIKREINRYVVETTQANIGIASIESFVYPLCSKQEQHQIVREIENRLSVCDKVEESIKESLQKAIALRQSILKKAFEGKLLSEEEITKCKADKNYEPASVLLEKIRAEKKKK